MHSPISVSCSFDKPTTSSKYFLEKTSNLLYLLLVGKGDARARLRENELNILYVLSLEIPDEFKPDQKKLRDLVCRDKMIQLDGRVLISSFQKTISGLRNSSASKIIAGISSLYYAVKLYKNKKVVN